VVVAGWWARHVALSLPRRLGLVIEPGGPAPPGVISVVVPARNEQAHIAACLKTLLDQGPAVGEVIVVDDRSDDGTGAAVMEMAAVDSRVRLTRVDTLPQGWAGKAHACHVGGHAATGEWILFTDADCRFLPGGLTGALAYAERYDVELLSLWPRADHRSFWEHMLIPLCGALILYWFPPLRANWASSRLAYASGQFILIRRDAYTRIDGHRSARNTVIEDVPLAQHAKRAGLRLRTALGADVMSVRMYVGYREIRNGWTRIFVGALQRPWKLLWSVWSLIGGSILPSVGAPVAAVVLWIDGGSDIPAIRVLCTLLWLHVVAVYTVSFRAWGLCRCRRRYLLFYPVSCAVVAALLLRAAWWMVARRPIVWRGSTTGTSVFPDAP